MWYEDISNDSDVVISTRLRYARNIAGYKFPHMMNNNEQAKIIKLIENVKLKDNYKLFKMKDIDVDTENSLMEKHLISKEFVGNDDGAIIASDKYDILCMINEEDHLRIQSFGSGFNPDKAYNNLVEFTNMLEKNIDFAKNDKYGYLTACPTNVGSGFRVSFMLHLPALAKIKMLNKLFNQITNIGLSVRGFYGENTKGDGYIYQISNQKTLGISDKEIINNVTAVVKTLIEQERKAREILKKNNLYLEDEVYRAYGTLKYSRVINEEEALKLLSRVRLGVSTSIIKEVDLKKIQNLMINIKPYTLKLILKQDIENDEDKVRADYIRKELK